MLLTFLCTQRHPFDPFLITFHKLDHSQTQEENLEFHNFNFSLFIFTFRLELDSNSILITITIDLYDRSC